MLEREVAIIVRDIDALQKNQESCDLQQKHNRDQIQALTQQEAKLQEKHDEYTRNMQTSTGGTLQRNQRLLEENTAFIQAAKNTRMTLLDQRAKTDMDKQSQMHALTKKKEDKAKYVRRLEAIKKVHSDNQSAGISDILIKNLKELKDKLNTRLQEKVKRDENSTHDSKKESERFKDAKAQEEADDAFFTDVEITMSELAFAKGTSRDRGKHLNNLLRDLVELQRSWNILLADKYVAEDKKCEDFFWKGSKKPPVKTRKTQGFFPAALPLQQQQQLTVADRLELTAYAAGMLV